MFLNLYFPNFSFQPSKTASINPVLQQRPRICNRKLSTARRQRLRGRQGRHWLRGGAAGMKMKSRDPHPAETHCWLRRQLRCSRRRTMPGGGVQALVLVLDCWFFPAPRKDISIIQMAAKQLRKLMTRTWPLISKDPPAGAFAPFAVRHYGNRHRIEARRSRGKRMKRSWTGKIRGIAAVPAWPKCRLS